MTYKSPLRKKTMIFPRLVPAVSALCDAAAHHARKLVLKIGLAAARIRQGMDARPLLATACYT